MVDLSLRGSRTRKVYIYVGVGLPMLEDFHRSAHFLFLIN